MRNFPMIGLLALLVACSDKSGDTGAATDGGTSDGGSDDGGSDDGGSDDGGSDDGGSDDGGSDDGGTDEEVCDGVDNDGDGEIDEGVTITFYADSDGDGYGDPLVTDELCEAVTGWVEDSADCDDSDAEVSPAGVEIYDSVDNDCSGVADDNLPHWSYDEGGEHVGPSEWPEFWPACDGEEQSPIDFTLKEVSFETLPAIAVAYNETTVKAVNNGHTIKWTVEDGGELTLDGTIYKLDQVHFHAGAEHTVDGEQYPLEAHMVHVDDKGTPDDDTDDSYLVMGVFIVESSVDSTLLTAMGWDSLPAKEDGELEDASMVFDPTDLLGGPTLGSGIETARYDGSFTAPPCSEGVQWVMSNNVLTASLEQLAAFTAIFDHNFRATQPMNGRVVVSDISL